MDPRFSTSEKQKGNKLKMTQTSRKIHTVNHPAELNSQSGTKSGT